MDKLLAKNLAVADLDRWRFADDIEHTEKLLMPIGHEWLVIYAARKAIEVALSGKIGTEFAVGAQFGAKFKGRGKGEGRVKKAIRAYLAKNPDAKPKAVWSAFLAKPPRGLTVRENSQGRYIESRDGDTSYATFQNSVAAVEKTQKPMG